MNPRIPLVVIGYNRPGALDRLLNSLLRAIFPSEVELIISIDGGGGEEVIHLARSFQWPFGAKRLILHEQNLGLRNHVLSCGDLALDYDAIIVLEDDLAVSPEFYHYALQAFAFYRDEPNVAGISLYHHAYNESAQFPFIPLADGSDVYFLQYASSWGQMWTRDHWQGFSSWYNALDPEHPPDWSSLPWNIQMWPKNSWKKYYLRYLAEHGLYFVYPRVSLTTVFSDAGTNIRYRETFLQVPLNYGSPQYRFKPFNDSGAVYDTWCEIIPDRLRLRWKDAPGEAFDVDLYGMKFNNQLKHGKVVSSRECRSPEFSAGREMKPHEENLVMNVPGRYFSFGERRDFSDPPYLARLMKCHDKKELAYWYPVREYHFYRQRLLTYGKASRFYFNPVFLWRKFVVMSGYAFRYFSKK